MLDIHESVTRPAEITAPPGGGAPPTSERPFLVGLKRGVTRHCPTCGKGPLFRGYLKIEEHCPVCGADNGRYPADDAPPYVTIFLVGHLTVPPILWFVQASTLSVGVILAIFIPLILLLSMIVLPFAKGAVVGLEWSWDIVRPDARAAEPAIAAHSPSDPGTLASPPSPALREG